MEQKFKIGDIVTLKSGGPSMTVSRVMTESDFKLGDVFSGNYQCTWFDDKNKHNQQFFPQDSLVIDK
jgi:uncharacterized protein YodC (DUF2158 family)